MSLTKAEKISALTKKKVTLEDLPMSVINKLYTEHIEEKKPKKDIDKTTDKYIVLLEFVNGMLKNIGKDEITDLRDFKDIYREDILKEENKQLLISMQKRLFTHFNKRNSGYYRKGSGWPLNVLRGMCKEIDLEITYKREQRSKNCVIDVKMLYTIK